MRVIAGKAKGRKLLSPENMDTRPTLDRIKESIFNIIQTKVPEAVTLDMFSGTGSLGLEAASRGAKESHLIEKSPIAYPLLKKNIENFKFEDCCKSYNMDAYDSLSYFYSKNIIFDIIFIDPPYMKDMIPKAIEIIEDKNLLQKDGLIVTKIDTKEEICEGGKDIKLFDHRKYGNTTVCFYRYEED